MWVPISSAGMRFGPSPIADRVLRELESAPHRVALVDSGRSYSAAELAEAIACAAGALVAEHGPQPRVLAILPNSAESVILFVATMAAGGVWGSVNPRYAVAEQEALSTRFDPDFVVSDNAAVTDLIASGSRSDGEWADVDESAPAAVGFTSGSSGRPRGIVHCQQSILLAAEANLSESKPDGPIGVVLSTMVLNIMILGPLQGLIAGRTVVLAQRTDADYLAQWFRDHAIAEIGVPPTIVHDLLDRYDAAGDGRVIPRHIETGGAACSAALQKRFHDRTGRTLIRCYGLTEAPGTVAVSPESWPAVLDSSGVALPHIALSVRGPAGEVLPTGTEGEICVGPAEHGPLAGRYVPMLGYLDEPDAPPVAGTVLRTGDLGRLDEEGRLYVTGRKSALIIRGGANISPAEVEQVLLDHPDISDAAVFGIPDERLGEIVAAAITMASGAALSAQNVLDHVAVRLARFKVPERIAFVDVIPRNPTGKPDREALVRALDPSRPSKG